MRTGRLSISRGHQLQGTPDGPAPPQLSLVPQPAPAEPAPPASPDYHAVHDRLTSLERLTRLFELGALSAEEFALIKRHPVDGAQMIMQSDQDLDLAAIVAYEHHMMLDGGGYPTAHYGRDSALASRLVHVCDVFDALRTRRPYRDAWESEKVFAYLLERAGTEFDPSLVQSFVEMLRRSELQVSAVPDEPLAAEAVV
jgi:hypothetical protein